MFVFNVLCPGIVTNDYGCRLWQYEQLPSVAIIR